MFSTTLRRRPSLSTLIPHLTSSTSPPLHETSLQTHDLALPNQKNPPSQPHLFLLLTPTTPHSPPLVARLTRFSTLTASPPPTILFLLSPSPSISPLHQLMQTQTLIHSLPTPIPLLPLPTPASLLPLLKTYTTSILTPTPTLPAPPTLPHLPHLTSTAPSHPLPTHATNVLSDLCGSIREVAELAETDAGRRVLVEWLGEEEGKGVVEFWEGEWVVG